MSAMLFIGTTFVLTLFSRCHSTPIYETDQCFKCQLMGKLLGNIAAKDLKLTECAKIPNCNDDGDICTVIQKISNTTTTYQEERTSNLGKAINAAIAKARRRCHMGKAVSIKNVEISRCIVCMLVYDVVQYLGLDVLNDDIEMSILMSIAEVVEQFPLGDSDEIMNGIKQVFDAMFHGFQDSLGGVYNLIAVKTLECPTMDILFQQCF